LPGPPAGWQHDTLDISLAPRSMTSRDRSVFGKYRVLARLGRGGMGDVFLAVNLGPSGVSKLIVVKELREQLASMPEARSMFLDEARVATRLNHPNVVQTYEVVEDGESLYLTMEFLDGQPLQNIIRGPVRAKVPLVLQLQILADTLAALHYAHELTDYDGTPLDVVHRDVSPHNVIVTYEGTAKLVDFGIAKAADAKTITESGVFKGKVRFSSPEQVVGTDIDRRSDVFAAGAVLWEILTGEQMWKGMPDTKVLVEIASGRIPAPRTVSAEVPEKLDAICAKALAFERDARYATANDFREALLEYIREARAPSEELGPILAAAFATERQEMRSVIDAELKVLREASSDSIRTRQLPTISTAPPSLTGSRPTHMAHARTARPGPSGKLVVPIALLVCGVLAAVIYTLTFPKHPPRATTVSAAPSPGVAMPVHLRLSARPATARFTIDGASVASNPYEADVPSDRGVHKIAIVADGFEPRELETGFERDVLFDVTLAPSAPAPAAAPDKARPSHAAAPASKAVAAPPMQKAQRSIEEEDPYQK
jgi:eukaryotic-like serine/threonine-protein kinase